jgi:hypothetical protein
VPNLSEAAEKSRQFHFWRIVIVCWAVVAFCAGSAWIISTYFND